jgi:hypothetical protein
MKTKLVFAMFMMSFFSQLAHADLSCTIIRGLESVELKIADTLIGTAVKIERVHPVIVYKAVDIIVDIEEGKNNIKFINDEAGFLLNISKKTLENSHTPLYKGFLKFDDISSQTFCRPDTDTF